MLFAFCESVARGGVFRARTGVVDTNALGETMTACELCRGACCESLLEPVPIDPVISEFRRARGKQITPKLIETETVCPSLKDGRCDRYNRRPAICEAYKVGGRDCRETVKRRRPKQAASILALL